MSQINNSLTWSPSDLQIKMARLNGKVGLSFNKPVITLIMEPNEALELAKLLKKYAKR